MAPLETHRQQVLHLQGSKAVQRVKTLSDQQLCEGGEAEGVQQSPHLGFALRRSAVEAWPDALLVVGFVFSVCLFFPFLVRFPQRRVYVL